jgi:hypothetical protein
MWSQPTRNYRECSYEPFDAWSTAVAVKRDTIKMLHRAAFQALVQLASTNPEYIPALEVLENTCPELPTK